MKTEGWKAMLVTAVVLAVACAATTRLDAPAWTPGELETLRSLRIEMLEPLPPDPSNRWADDERAVALGHELFFDTRLSGNGEVSCATCHRPELQFQDGTPLAAGVGTTDRRTMTVVATAHSPWLFWDGRKDSQWSQALGPLESPVEHGGDRTRYAHLVGRHYRVEYEALFGALPELDRLPPSAGPVPDPAASRAWSAMAAGDREAVSLVYANLGKALAAYQRRLEFGPARFDRYMEAVLAGEDERARGLLTPQEEEGLRLFIGKAQCVTCHNGPLFTDNFFHNTGVPAVRGLPEDRGRALGAIQVQEDEFNCVGPFSDAGPRDCAELRFMAAEGDELLRAYKTPTLRGVARRAPYMHAGQLSTLTDVVRHYDRAPRAPAGRSELRRLRLSQSERTALEAFLRALDSPVEAPPELLRAPGENAAAADDGPHDSLDQTGA